MNVRQFSYVMLFLLVSASVLIQCKSSEASVSSEQTTATMDVTGFAHIFVESIRTNQIDDLYNLMPDIEMARAISPKETKGLSDEEINEKMLVGLK